MYDSKDPKSIEKYSSAVTLSDMEIFIFPELAYTLVLANIMSPLLWQWKDDPWFSKIKKMSEYRRILRTKQFIMDKFSFNLDLDTWGLTTKEKELHRFSRFIDESTLAQSNALFGYEGDKYYFDMDIRRHFGLDNYSSNIIPYWKTETVESMEAFKLKENYPTGAGECVSLSTLYASSLFVIANIPLEKIHVLATPLHSQNFIDVKEGVLTNNRRIVTKNMWFNGTELSAKARRALENEQVTLVANNSGYIHTLYNEATMPLNIYQSFSSSLKKYLKTDINFDILSNFLRQNNPLQRCFQIAHTCCGKHRFIEAEVVFHYEHSSKSRIGDKTQELLLHEIDEDEFYTSPIPNRIILNELESFFKNNDLPVDCSDTVEKLKSYLRHSCYNVEEVINDLVNFCRIEPRLPSTDKKVVKTDPIKLDGLNDRERVIEYLKSIRTTHPIADLTFMTYRDMKLAPWKPFIKAAFERNPVCLEGSKNLTIDTIAAKLKEMNDQSIYDGTRMAQPDEVWNYNVGDGLEKALCLMSILKNRLPEDDAVSLEGDGKMVVVRVNNKEYQFKTDKNLPLPTDDDFNV